MKNWHWILIALAVGGIGFAVYWFYFRTPSTNEVTGNPEAAAKSASTAQTNVGNTTVAAPIAQSAGLQLLKQKTFALSNRLPPNLKSV